MSDYKTAAKASRKAKLAKYADGGAVDDAGEVFPGGKRDPHRARDTVKPNNLRYGWQRRTESSGIRVETPSWGKDKSE